MKAPSNLLSLQRQLFEKFGYYRIVEIKSPKIYFTLNPYLSWNYPLLSCQLWSKSKSSVIPEPEYPFPYYCSIYQQNAPFWTWSRPYSPINGRTTWKFYPIIPRNLEMHLWDFYVTWTLAKWSSSLWSFLFYWTRQTHPEYDFFYHGF